uniref:Cold-induced small protein n=1 Tax=Hordeum vulgare TaxID=4513 RepID=A0A1W7GKT6_HORVU|nr:cold-induced small protein [Hordeum vulgare]
MHTHTQTKKKMGQSPLIRLPEAEQVQPLVAIRGSNRMEQLGKSTKAMNKYYKSSSKDDLVLRATLDSITRMG